MGTIRIDWLAYTGAKPIVHRISARGLVFFYCKCSVTQIQKTQPYPGWLSLRSFAPGYSYLSPTGSGVFIGSKTST
jgi:hypothetical protein